MKDPRKMTKDELLQLCLDQQDILSHGAKRDMLNEYHDGYVRITLLTSGEEYGREKYISMDNLKKELELCMFELLYCFYKRHFLPDSAPTSGQLDGYAELYGVERGAMTDDQLRALLVKKIREIGDRANAS